MLANLGTLPLATGSASNGLTKALPAIAVVFGTINVVGGFLVTDRMLELLFGDAKASITAISEEVKALVGAEVALWAAGWT